MEECVLMIREAGPDDLPCLRDMLWEATAVAAEVRALGKQAGLALPEIRRYLADWGRAGDIAIVARDGSGECLGAAWLREFPAQESGYGFVAPEIPELAIGVAAPFRGRGIGGALLDRLLEHARAAGYHAVSLSVDRRNPARRLYERKGFAVFNGSNSTSDGLTMVAALRAD
jgi:GNAT superfamily N-acetyltransferase